MAEPRDNDYPPYVVTPEQKRRWDAALAAARNIAPAIGGNEQTVWLATRSLYKSDIPTGQSPEKLPEPKPENPSDQ